MKQQKWFDKPYHSLDYHYKTTFSGKVYKLSLDGGFTCPNRDGTLGTKGCIFCSEGGSGDFASSRTRSISDQLFEAKQLLSSKVKSSMYIAYFQAFTNTYAPIEKLNYLYHEALLDPEVVGLSIATRPDCLPEDTLQLLEQLNTTTSLYVELGLQTIHERTASFIRRGYPLSTFETAVHELNKRKISIVVHVILGLPGETKEDIYQTIAYLNTLPIQGVKLSMLHVLKHTDLATCYANSEFSVFTLQEYVDVVCHCIGLLRQDIVIHRITGDGPKNLLLAPLWSANKKLVLNTIHKTLKEKGIYQGLWEE